MSKDDVVDLDAGENWMVSHRKRMLKEMGWEGTIQEWQTAIRVLGKSPLDLEPPIKSLEAAKNHAEKTK